MTTTKKDFFAAIITAAAEAPEAFTLQTPEDVIEFCNREIDTLNRRAAAPKTPTKNQRANDTIKQTIVSLLAAADAPMSIKDMQESGKLIDESGTILTNQKINSLLTQLKREGKVSRMEGKAALFMLAA